MRKFIVTKYHPISLNDTLSDCQDMFIDAADVFFADIANQLTVIIAYTINCTQYIQNLKPLIV